jgi:hypothetical protein
MTEPEKITAERIIGMLENKHAGESWAFVKELRTSTGYRKRACYIDCYAIELWGKSRNYIAYEIKISRGDFKSDVQNFNVKQADAIANSSQFYYVCPFGLIDPTEVPESTGLMWVDKGGVKIKKVAPLRDLKSGLDALFVGALMRASVVKQIKNPLWKYLGSDLTEDDLRRIAIELYGSDRERDIKNEVEKRVKATNAEHKSVQAMARVVEALRSYGWGKDVWEESEIVAACEKIKKSGDAVRMAENLHRNIFDIEKNTKNLLSLLKGQVDSETSSDAKTV